MNHIAASLTDPILDRLGVVPAHVDADLHYLARIAERPFTYTFDPPPNAQRSNIEAETHTVPIYDLRPVAPNLSIDREGFELLQSPTAMGDFYDDEQVRHAYALPTSGVTGRAAATTARGPDRAVAAARGRVASGSSTKAMAIAS